DSGDNLRIYDSLATENQTYTLSSAVPGLRYLDRTGAARITYRDVPKVQINGGQGSDRGKAISVAAANITFDGGGAAGTGETLIGRDGLAKTTVWNITGTRSGDLNWSGQKLSFTNIENLIGGSGADRFKFLPGTGVASIDGGAGSNTFDYSAFTVG